MRENKFRGKCIAAGELKDKWVYGDLIKSRDKFFIHPHSQLIEVSKHYGRLVVMHEVDPETVGQYSNYYDIKFYDGDIISVDCDCDSEYGCNHLDGRYLVTWNEETTGYALKNLNNRIFYALDNFGEENMHNIGNQWDNPDLLEVTNE